MPLDKFGPANEYSIARKERMCKGNSPYKLLKKPRKPRLRWVLCGGVLGIPYVHEAKPLTSVSAGSC
jgi:hypothetical protein